MTPPLRGYVRRGGCVFRGFSCVRPRPAGPRKMFSGVGTVTPLPIYACARVRARESRAAPDAPPATRPRRPSTSRGGGDDPISEVLGLRAASSSLPSRRESRGWDLDQTPRRAVEVESDEHAKADDRCSHNDGDQALTEHREVESEEAERDRRTEEFEPEHRVGHAIVQPGESNGLVVDHVVEAFQVQPGCAVAGAGVQALTRETPETALQLPLLRGSCADRRTAGDLVRDSNREVVVAPKERERRRALGLGDRLRPQVRGADRVRVGNDISATILIAANSEREAKARIRPTTPSNAPCSTPIGSRYLSESPGYRPGARRGRMRLRPLRR